MNSTKNTITINLNKKLATWFEDQEKQGYKKAKLIREALTFFMDSQDDIERFLGGKQLSDPPDEYLELI
ncbi:MAG TPA: hypothetical protein VNF06_01815 [Candidatus Aquilonibacter sp.]|nr:hypothetical protein [Candidatus Aquilonibacter sp.]